MSLATEISDRASALEFLLGRINYERTSTIPYTSGAFKLDRMRSLLSRLRDPHLALRAVHIAGTKGKGSTAAMIASVLSAAGYCTGLYTSPHLDRLEERFLIDGRQCSERELVRLSAEVQVAVLDVDRQSLDGEGLTFFEVTTAMAMLHFARSPVDVAVLEVGLGGRLDSTNVCLPEVCVVTSISFDHTKQLGNTLSEIATEKAGIIKPGVPVVSGVVADEPRRAIERVASQQGAPLVARGKAFDAVVRPQPEGESLAGQRIDYWENSAAGRWTLDGIHLPFLGDHQAANAAAAIAALRQLTCRGFDIPNDAIRLGLSQTRCHARIELIRRRPNVIADVAHNVASVQALVEVVRREFPTGKRILLFASSRDKDIPGMLRVLLPEFNQIVLTRFVTNPRAVEVDELHSLARETLSDSRRAPPAIAGERDPVAAWELARGLAHDDDLICITGSFFLAAELLPLVR
jgi:dihydrofolate synthase/folylpolyglutamate synthase